MLVSGQSWLNWARSWICAPAGADWGAGSVGGAWHNVPGTWGALLFEGLLFGGN